MFFNTFKAYQAFWRVFNYNKTFRVQKIFYIFPSDHILVEDSFLSILENELVNELIRLFILSKTFRQSKILMRDRDTNTHLGIILFFLLLSYNHCVEENSILIFLWFTWDAKANIMKWLLLLDGKYLKNL